MRNPSQLQKAVDDFDGVYERCFGAKVDHQEIKDYLSKIIEEKRLKFINSWFDDFSPTELEAMLEMFKLKMKEMGFVEKPIKAAKKKKGRRGSRSRAEV